MITFPSLTNKLAFFFDYRNGFADHFVHELFQMKNLLWKQELSLKARTASFFHVKCNVQQITCTMVDMDIWKNIISSG